MNDSNLRLFTTKINFKEKHQTLLINYFFSIFIFLSFLLPSKSYAACPAYVGSAGAETITEGGITYDVIYFAHPGLVSPTSGLLGSSTNPITDWNSSNGGMDAINDCAGDIYMKFITSCNYNSNGTGGDMTYTAQFINASINNVIIDGQGSIITNFAAAASWIRVDGRTNWKIRNLSFIGYNANAILFTDMINTRIENCIFDSNPTMRAVRIDNDDNASDVTIINSVFSNNSPVSETPSTGALEIREDEFAGPLVVHITDTDFSCNRTQGFGGGAIWISVTSFPSNGGPTVNITGGTFSGNFSGTDTGDGGAIGINGSTSVLNINGSTFSCNHSRASTGAGGGGAIRIAAGPDVTIQNATFYGNYCTNSAGSVAAGGYGGAINISSTSNISTLSISNSTFEANQASRGGAFYLENGTTPVTFNNVLIKGNSSASEGGGGIFSDGVSFSLTNTSVINNTSPATFAGGIAGSGTVTLTNSLISGNSAPETSGVTLSGSSSGAGTTTPMSSITSCPSCIPAISTTCDANGGDAITISGCNNFCSSSAGGSPVSTGNSGFNVTNVSGWLAPICTPVSDYNYVYLVVNAAGVIVQIIDGDADNDGTPDFEEMPAINTLVDFDIASLPPGTYTIYGFHYRINPPASAFVPAPTVGMLLSQIQSAITTGGATGCGSLTTGTTMGMVLDPILINVSTSCFEADGVTPAPTGTFYVIVNSITGGLPQKLGTGTYTITGIPGITSYVFGSGVQRSTAITYVAGSSLSISVTDNNDPDGNTVGGSPSCVDCMVNTSLAHISCDACPTPEADITNGDPANSDGDNNPHTITICSGGTVPGTLTIVTGDNAIVTSVNVNGAPHVTGIVRTEGSFIANGGQIETGTLVNSGTTTQVIIYTVCPYNYGPDGIDNGAMGDDCVAVAGADDNGLTDGVIGSCVTYTVTILPTPEADILIGDPVNGDGDSNPHTITICSGGTVPGLLTIVSGTNGLVTSVVAGGNITGVTTAVNQIIANGGQIETGTLVNIGTTTQTVVYTICPYNNGPNGTDDSGTGDDCLASGDINGLTDNGIASCVTYTVTILPTPEADITDGDPTNSDSDGNPHTLTICSGGTVPGTLTLVSGTNGFVTSVVAGSNITGVTTTVNQIRANGATIETGILVNTGTTTQTVVYTICPYNNGPNGTDNSGTGDDCRATGDINGLTNNGIGSCVTYTVTILPTPEADITDGDPTNSDGDGNPHTLTICSGGTVPGTLTLVSGTNGLVTSVVAGSNITGVTTAVNQIRVNGATIETGTLVNTGTTSQTVVYTICPYNNGPNGTDNSGTGDDCRATGDINGLTNNGIGSCVTYTVTILPTPEADITDGDPTNSDGDGNPHTLTICSGGTVPGTLTLVSGTNGLVTSVVAGSNITGVTTAVNQIRANGATIETGTLVNTGTTSQTVVYTICPYNNGPNGTDNSGTGDDCRATGDINGLTNNGIGSCVTYTVTVQVVGTITAQNTCLGGSSVIFTGTGAESGTWSVSGGGTINPVTGEFTPTTAGCFIATFTTSAGACMGTASFLVYPSEPVLTAPANTCNAAFVLPAVTPVVGFTVQYSINGGTWATAPTIPTTPGCHTIAARYVNTAACGLTAALTPSAIAGCDASADVIVLIYSSEPVLTAPANTCNAAFVLPVVTPVVGFTVQYSINGGAWATAPTIPTTPGCHTIAARYVNTAACGLTAALTPSAISGCDASADVSVLIYPSEPVLTAPANTCNAAFVLPAVTPVVGFTVQYSINGGAWATAPTIPTTPGCHTIAARYVNTAACGLTAALTPSTIAGCDASADVTVLIYPSEPVLTAPANTCDAAFVLPAVTPVVGFTVQYSINGGAWATAPAIPTTPGCHTIAARYVNTAACGLTAALTPSAIAGCDASADVSVLIYPSEPVLTAPANTCNTAFVLPVVAPVAGFTVQYSINGGAWATAPAIPTTPGCHTIAARYVNTAACGLTAALTPSAIAGCDASADVSVLIYPSEPVLTAPTNTCNAAFVLPAVTPVVGFTVQYSINGGAWATAPAIPTTPGCHTIAARYVNTAACGLTAALTPSAISGCDASADVSVLIYPSEPVLTAPTNTCNAAFVLPAVTPVVGFTVQYSINGGTWATAPTIPTTPGCHTIAARYVNTAACGLTAALTPSAITGCDASADVSVLIYPSEPVLTAPANTCNAAFVLPVVTPVVGFTVQYSINGGAWATAPTIPTTPGCHTIAARYVNTAACGLTAALSPSAIAGCDASADVSVLIYPSEPVITAPTNTCNAAFVLPAVTPVVGFTVQYSINGGAWATAPTIPTTPGCHTIAARYVNTAACGLTAALTPSTIAGCDASAMVSVVIFPSAPVITMPRASCMSDFILPAVPPVAGFSIQYSINGGAWTANPMTSMVPGCYSIQARYVLETACGTTLAGTAGTGSCGESNMVNTNVYPVPVIEPVADVFMCDMSQVNVTFSSLTEILSCYGNASIQYQWTNNNTSIGLAASGTGNISFIATQPGTAFIIVTPVFTGPDGNCKGQPISFIISIHQETSIVCNDRVHVSLDENCEFNMSGDFILEGSYNEYFYNVVIKTSTGEIIDNSNVTLHIGEVLIAEVTDICNGNRCWGEVIFEDKLAPVVECNCSGPVADVSAFREIGVFGNKKYYLSNATYTWQQAYAHAQSVGGEMLCITSAAENAFILNTWSIPGFASQRTWLGATDNEAYGGTEANNTNNGWVWVSGEPFSYTNWASGEPNGLANEDYVEMFGTGGTEPGRWNDNTNTFGPLRYIMEVENCSYNCYDLAVIQNETVPMLYGVSPNKSVLTTPPTATDGCGPVSATFTDAINGGDQCDTRELVRSWTFEDASGNKSYCTQRFAFEPISVTDLIPPVREVHLTCGLDATPAAIAGYLDVDSRTQLASATNIGAYADDYAQTGSVVELHEGYANGYFTYNQIGYDGRLHAQKVDNNVCNLYTTYTDDVIPACGIGCSGNMKVIRNWKLLDWCTGEVYTYTQVIKATDEKAPTFTVKNATVGVDPWGCAANWNVGQPWELADNCAKAEEIKWGVKVPSGVTLSGTAPNYRITGLTKGTHKITYWASDCCGNVSEKDAYVTVIDASAPVAVAKQNIVMSLTGSGTGADGAGKIYGWQIDNGSYDHCSDVRFEVRRVDGGSCGNVGANGTHNNNSTYNDNNGYPSEVPGAVWFHPQDNAQDTDGGAFVKFCCDDIPSGADYGLHDVELRVWDDGNMNGIVGDNDIIDGMKDNYNTTWVTIRVENKLPPALVCPPDVTITCDMELNLSLDAETNVNDVNLTMTGYPQAFDLCSNLQVTYKDQWVGSHDPVCKSGTVRRTFKVTKGAVVVTCAQFITVSTITVPFTVTFPGQNQTDAWDKCSFTLEDARDAANATIKRPIVNYGQCDIVGENITIDTFLFEDGACKKWRVKYSYKNWCTGEEINTIAGQPIVHWYAFKDVTAPVLSCTNQMFAANPNSQNPNGGCEAAVALEASASDKLICAEESWIKWQMFFDGWNDGTVDRLGSSFVNKSWNGIWVPQAKYIANVLNPTWVALQDQHPNLPLADLVYVTYIKPTAASGGTAKLPVGTGATAFILNAENISHKVLWKVTDGCGNVDQCESTVMVVDKKAPTPYCVSVSTALMQTNPQMVELWARDFDKGAFDNCTPQSKLYFTFDGAAPIYSRVNEEHFYKVVGGVSVNATAAEYAQGKAYRWLPTSRSAGFVWTTAGDFNVQVSVWDEAWNTDYCTVVLSVRGGNGSTPSSRVSGTVATILGQGVNNVSITFDANMSEYPKTVQTAANGTFDMSNYNGLTYEITASKGGDYLNGVSTLDLVMIQRHILGLQALDSNYKLIAADANNDGKVTASDLTDLRKLILGVTTALPNNTSWKFPVAGTSVGTSPITCVELIEIENLSADKANQNFVAVKIGDVNGNVSTSVNSPEVESRSNANVEMSVAEASIAAGEVVEIPVTAANFSEVSGFQYTMNLNGASFVGVQSGVLEVNANNVGVISDNVVTMSYASTEAVNANEGAVLFTLTVKADKAMKVSEMISLNSEVTRAESYNSDLKVGRVSLGVRTAPVAGIELFQNEPNPFKGMTTVSFEMPEAATATLSVYDVTGKVVTVRNINAIKGLNSEIFTKDQLGVSGVLYYTLVSGDFTATKKMIIVE